MSETDKPAALSAVERKRRERSEKRANGLVPFEAWTYPETKEAAKAAVAEVNNKHAAKLAKSRAAAQKRAKKAQGE